MRNCGHRRRSCLPWANGHNKIKVQLSRPTALERVILVAQKKYLANMAIRSSRTRGTSGMRNQSVFDSANKKKVQPAGPQGGLTRGLATRAGRNNRGIITSRGRGGGHKRLYRQIDYRRGKSVPGRIVTVEYDPNRSARISLVHYGDGDKGYTLHPEEVRLGDVITTGPDAPVAAGNTLPLSAV